MTRTLSRIVALCLALVWLPATMCCALEAAGVEALCSSDACHDKDSTEMPLDGCSVVEDGDYQSAVSLLKIARPVGTLLEYLSSFRVVELEVQRQEAVLVAETARPCEWLPVWHFERRAAAPAHAPDSLIA
jgi:hypothetical protein